MERILRYHKKQLKYIRKQVLSSFFHYWNVVYYVKKSERADTCVMCISEAETLKWIRSCSDLIWCAVHTVHTA